MGIFKSRQKKFEGNLKIRLCIKRLCPTDSVKYLGVKIDANLSWQCQVNDLSINDLSYCSLVCAQNFRTI